MLTDTRVRSAKPIQRSQKLTDARGLYLLVTPSGGKYWRYDYSFNDKRKTLALGVYPDVGLGKARERHHEARQQLAEGVDPGEVQQSIKQDFEGVARAWLAHWRTGRSDRYVGYVIARLEADVFPQIGARPISELATSEFRDVARNIERRGASEIARGLLQQCGQIMRYAVANDFAQRNPVSEIRPADILKPRKKRNYPRVTAKELPNLLHAIDGYAGVSTRDSRCSSWP